MMLMHSIVASTNVLTRFSPDKIISLTVEYQGQLNAILVISICQIVMVKPTG